MYLVLTEKLSTREILKKHNFFTDKIATNTFLAHFGPKMHQSVN